MPVIKRISLRRGVAEDWTAKDPVLGSGEPGYEIDTGKIKIGNGVLRWSQLKYFAPEGDESAPVTVADLEAHIASSSPHPAYDNMPSLALIYQNAKV